jgi:hypothetical protein
MNQVSELLIKGYKWSFASFARQANALVVIQVTPAPRTAYLQAQQELIDADIDCRFCSDPQFPAPYLHMTVSRGSQALRAKAVIISGRFSGCFRRSTDHTEERFDLGSSDALIKLLITEVNEPSMNFCTVFGD